jgi:signal transduction histidine kinase
MEHYRQIERDRQPIIVNDSRQSLLSWLWSKVMDDARSSSLYRATRAWMALPLRFREEVLGVLRVDHHEQGYFDPERVKLLKAIGSQAALAMHHSKLQEQERAVAVIAERNRIARELHDAVSQTLFAAHVQAGTLVKVASRGAAAIDLDLLRRLAAELERLTRGALAEMRILMYELRPDALQGARLADLLQHVVGALQCRGEYSVTQNLAEREPLSDTVRTHVYRIAQEAISNAARHSGARNISITWTVDAPAGPTLTVADDGKGFDPSEERPGHFGLANMRSRAEEIGATLSVDSTPGKGTEVRLTLGGLDDADAAPRNIH